MLGIGFHGSFFNAESDPFEDNPRVHLALTEKFRVSGSVFLNYVAYNLQKVLTEKFGTKIQVVVESRTDILKTLMCHYTMDYIWTQISKSPNTVNKKLVVKMTSLIEKSLKNMSKEELEHAAAYLKSSPQQIKELLSVVNRDHHFPNTDLALKAGHYVLSLKMYCCVEMQLLPKLNSGWFFPIILKPIDTDHDLI